MKTIFIIIEYSIDEPSVIHGIFEKFGMAVQVATELSTYDYFSYSKFQIKECALNQIEEPFAAYTPSGKVIYDRIQEEAEKNK